MEVRRGEMKRRTLPLQGRVKRRLRRRRLVKEPPHRIRRRCEQSEVFHLPQARAFH